MRGKRKEGINEEISDEQWLKHFMSSLGGSSERRRCDLGKIEATADMNLKEEEIKRAIGRLGKKKAPGGDGIPGEVWRICEDLLVTKLREILEGIYKEGILPKEWKKGVVVPVFKKGEKKLVKNYRPVALMDNRFVINQIFL